MVVTFRLRSVFSVVRYGTSRKSASPAASRCPTRVRIRSAVSPPEWRALLNDFMFTFALVMVAMVWRSMGVDVLGNAGFSARSEAQRVGTLPRSRLRNTTLGVLRRSCRAILQPREQRSTCRCRFWCPHHDDRSLRHISTEPVASRSVAQP